jgi:hypothetical protein
MAYYGNQEEEQIMTLDQSNQGSHFGRAGNNMSINEGNSSHGGGYSKSPNRRVQFSTDIGVQKNGAKKLGTDKTHKSQRRSRELHNS